MATNNNILEKSIGSGVLFPIQLEENSDGKTGWYPKTGTTDLIIHNLNSVLQYELGFRIRQEDFGTRLWECLEEPNTQAQTFLVNQFLKQALVKFESRIKITRTDVIRQGTSLKLSLAYSIRELNVEDNVTVTYEI